MRPLQAILTDAKSIAAQYEDVTGRPLGLTDEIGECEAAARLGLSLAPAHEPYCDALDLHSSRLLIRSRRVTPERRERNQRVPAVRRRIGWDAVLLVLLDERYDAIEIWRAERLAVLDALDPAASRRPRRALNVSQFKSIGRLVWSDAGRWTHPPPLRDYRFGERRRT
ncbi:hypothetical protein [Acuticoccus sp. I52.16.1]|uniref:hypothetical protein n=1 Tax=Acuticoccus sp. I52.16.1 TaxID=2928472 RepID=UPI001FD02240|nr:hypothetical protein [Acuticoccus sp. I52.16.1]UOM36456.1 hypothetical protein MRB58_09815 [Acuticoccus sp. I52.16.1]